LAYSGDLRQAGVADRAARTTGRVRLTKAVVLDREDNARWDYKLGETARFHFEYEVGEPVAEFFFLLRFGLASEQVVFEIGERLNTAHLRPGCSGEVRIDLPISRLLPNDYSLYVWIGRADRSETYDVLDKNVNLPEFVIQADTEALNWRRGLMTVDYELRQVEAKALVQEEALSDKNLAHAQSLLHE
jgi:hypothetical protein